MSKMKDKGVAIMEKKVFLKQANKGFDHYDHLTK